MKNIVFFLFIVLSTTGCSSQPDVITLYSSTNSFSGRIAVVGPYHGSGCTITVDTETTMMTSRAMDGSGQYATTAVKETGVLTFNSDTTTGKSFNINKDYRDIIIMNSGRYILNPKYANKLLKFVCAMNDDQIPEKILKIELPDVDDYQNATSKVYDLKQKDKLIGVCDNHKLIEISNVKSQYLVGTENVESGKHIQGNDELCADNSCIKIDINKDGYIVGYTLPNITDGTVLNLKFVGNTIEVYHEGDNKLIGAYPFKGDKMQAALIAVAMKLFDPN